MTDQQLLLLQPFIDYLKFEKRYSKHTVRSYQDDLAQFLDYLQISFGSLEWKEVSASIIRSWMASMKETGITSRTIRRKISTLRSFFKYQVKTGALEISPVTQVTVPKMSKRLPAFVQETDMAQLLSSIRFSEDWKGYNAKMLFNLFYATGMRLSELIQMQPTQVDHSKGQLRILGKGNKERIIPVHPQLIALIEEYEQAKKKEFEKPDSFLLVTEKGKKLYPKYAYLIVNHYLSEIKTLEKKSPHILRHSFATHLTNHGASLNAVKELLGHSSLASTQVYTHNTIEKLKEVYKKAHPKEQDKH